MGLGTKSKSAGLRQRAIINSFMRGEEKVSGTFLLFGVGGSTEVCGAGAALWNGDVGSPDYPTVELRRYLTSSRTPKENSKKGS